MEDIRKRIKSGEIDKTVNAEKQNRHIRGSSKYVEGRSYLLDGVDAQALVDRYHGTGNLERSKIGQWSNRETIIADVDIGVCINILTGKKNITNRFTIHYSGTGTHVVPAERR